MKFKDVSHALSVFETATIQHQISTKDGESARKINAYYNKIIDSVRWLYQNNQLIRLNRFYDCPNLATRSWASSFLLEIDTDNAQTALNKLVEADYMNAQYILDNWKDGTLDLEFYKKAASKQSLTAKIQSSEEAVAVIIASSITQKEAEQEGNFKLYNQLSEKIWKAEAYLQKTNHIDQLLPLLRHEEAHVRFCAASTLIETNYKEQAIACLENMKREEGKISFEAKALLNEFYGKEDDLSFMNDDVSFILLPSPPQATVPKGVRADGLIGLADMFSRPDVSVFKVMNFFEAEDPAEYLLMPTAFELIPDEDDDSARFYFIKALQVFADKTVPCYMSMDTDERLTEYVVKKTETGIVLEEMDGQEHSVIPAIASDRYGRNSELYYAEENPRLGFEILKAGLNKARDKEIVKDDIAMLKDEIDYRQREKK